jgi:hypothetical protein
MMEISGKDARNEGFRLCGMPGVRGRYGSKSTQNILAECGFIMRNGVGYTIKSKSIGAGIYEVWAEEKK